MKKLIYLIVAFSLVFCGACATQQKPPASLGGASPWPRSAADAQGLDPTRLQKMVDWMRSSGLVFHSVIIIRNGTLVMEEYFPGGGREVKQGTWSCTKSVLSALCGIARAEGTFPALDSSALSSFPEGIVGMDARARQMTVAQLLTMQSGMAAMRGVDMAGAEDQLAYVLKKTLTYDPGARFLYTTGGPHVVSAVLQQSVGMSARDYARKKLFEPLGIQDWSWDTDGLGVSLGGLGLAMRPFDLAKFGYLFLKKGDWFGQRIVPASWVEESTASHARVTDMNRAESSGYGYLWWVDEQWAGYSAHGAAGQFVFVLPKKDMVVVFTSALSFERFPVPWDLMNEYVLPAAGPA